jgi:hypothetical protein
MPFEPKPGDFEVVRMGGAGGFWIKVGQILNGDDETEYQHARLYLGNKKVVEAEPGGARIVDWNPNDNGFWSTGLIDLTPLARRMIVAAGYKYGNDAVGYSAADYFALVALRLKMGALSSRLRAFVRSSGHMICSQLVDQCYKDAGIQLFEDGRFAGDVTPADLANLLLRKMIESQEKHSV